MVKKNRPKKKSKVPTYKYRASRIAKHIKRLDDLETAMYRELIEPESALGKHIVQRNLRVINAALAFRAKRLGIEPRVIKEKMNEGEVLNNYVDKWLQDAFGNPPDDKKESWMFRDNPGYKELRSFASEYVFKHWKNDRPFNCHAQKYVKYAYMIWLDNKLKEESKTTEYDINKHDVIDQQDVGADKYIDYVFKGMMALEKVVTIAPEYSGATSEWIMKAWKKKDPYIICQEMKKENKFDAEQKYNTKFLPLFKTVFTKLALGLPIPEKFLQTKICQKFLKKFQSIL